MGVQMSFVSLPATAVLVMLTPYCLRLFIMFTRGTTRSDSPYNHFLTTVLRFIFRFYSPSFFLLVSFCPWLWWLSLCRYQYMSVYIWIWLCLLFSYLTKPLCCSSPLLGKLFVEELLYHRWDHEIHINNKYSSPQTLLSLLFFSPSGDLPDNNSYKSFFCQLQRLQTVYMDRSGLCMLLSHPLFTGKQSLNGYFYYNECDSLQQLHYHSLRFTDICFLVFLFSCLFFCFLLLVGKPVLQHKMCHSL